MSSPSISHPPPSSQQQPQPQINPLARSSYPDTITITPDDLRRADESPDPLFYSFPRFVQHIDGGAISALKSYYTSVVQPGSHIIDVCSSWTSHLPDTLLGKLPTCVGYGLNEEELAHNPHLTSHHVRDLNVSPSLSEIGDGDADVVICNVSIDYLTRPVEVVGEVRRVLKRGGTAHLAFSNRCFHTKVVEKWLGMGDEERRRWVGGYFWADGGGRGWEGVEEVILIPEEEARARGEDPLYVVRARKVGGR